MSREPSVEQVVVDSMDKLSLSDDPEEKEEGSK